MSDHDAEKRAIGRFGPAEPFARTFDRFELPFRMLLIVASLATVAVGLWLVFVIAVVLPMRDPGHLPLWRWVATGFFTYSALTWMYLLRGPRRTWLRLIVFAVSSLAVALGLYGIVNTIQVANAGGHFDGYIILMGLILAVHGLCAIVYTILTRRLARQIGAA